MRDRASSAPRAAQRALLSEETAWELLLAGVRVRRAGRRPSALAVRAGGLVDECRHEDPESALEWQDTEGWRRLGPAEPAAEQLLALHLPLLRPGGRAPTVVAHLGQSLDGFVATADGDSHYINDAAGLTHLHRLRALSDAVVVGAGTAASDDPRLTVRRVAGDHPLRVVIAGSRPLPGTLRVFSDGAAPTLLFTPEPAPAGAVGAAEVVAVAADAAGRVQPAAVLEALARRGVASALLEGGGVTVSRFLAAGVLDRLQIAVAPLLIGAGRTGLRVAPKARLADCLRPAARSVALGRDVLFDLDLRD